jgi:hypothetical protein
LLVDGTVLLAGGTDGSSTLDSADLYDRGLGVTIGQPIVATPGTVVPQSSGMLISGTGFTGLSSASGDNGSQNSATNYPLFNVHTIGNEQDAYTLPQVTAAWSSTSFNSNFPTNVNKGLAYSKIFANGIPSVAQVIFIGTALTVTTVPNLTVPQNPATTSISLSAKVSSIGPVNEGNVLFVLTDSHNNVVKDINGNPGETGTVTNGVASATFPFPPGLQLGNYTITASYIDSGASFRQSNGSGSFKYTSSSPPVSQVFLPFIANSVGGW